MDAEGAAAIDENGGVPLQEEAIIRGDNTDPDEVEVEIALALSLTNHEQRDNKSTEIVEINLGNEDLKENGSCPSNNDSRNAVTHDAQTQERKPASSKKSTTTSARKARFQTLVRSFFAVDYTQAALIPGMRTSLIIMLFWIIFGIGNSTSTSFQLGALYVGLTDPNGNLSRRLHSMGLTLISVVLLGTAIPYGAHSSVPGTICAAFAVAFSAGCAPLLGDPALVLALKLGTALFAIHGAVHRNRSGNYYEEFNSTTLWTFIGGSCSLGAALLPELIGNRDAVRTDLFKVWHGFGRNLGRWSASWGTGQHTGQDLVPHVTTALALTMDRIQHDTTEDPKAKQWLLKIMDHANTIRTSSLCLSNMTINKKGDEEERILDDLFQALACTVRDIGFAFQFPWMVRFVPFIRQWVLARAEHFETTTKAAIHYVESCNRVGNEQHSILLNCMPSLVNFLQLQVKESVDMVLDGKQRPPYSSPCTLPQRIRAAFPKKVPSIQEDTGWAVCGYAIRFALAFTLAILPEVLMTNRSTSAHWFPMTVALIMGPSYAATYQKVSHRTIGTLLGIALGSVLSPLFRFPGLLILLLGLNTYAVCVFFTANYAIFTVFITSWVFCTTVGVGASMGITVFYRILWTLAAAVLVLVVTYTYPPRTEFHLTAKLAEFARVIKVFAETVVEQHRLVQSNDDNDGDNNALLVEAAAQRVEKARKVAARTRLALFTDMYDAVLTPTEGYRIDPHSVAPQVASDLIDAVVIPLFLSLIKDGSADSLLSDLEDNMKELERLIQRLKAQAALPPGRPDTLQQRTDTSIDSSRNNGQGPFSIAIAKAHRTLDEAGVPVGPSSPPTLSDSE